MKKYIQIKGITLVSLIITVIILLILAGVGIGLFGGDGLIQKARVAREQTEIEDEKEIVETSVVEAVSINRYGNIEKSELEVYIQKNANERPTEVIEDVGILYAHFKDTDRYYKVEDDGDVSNPIEKESDEYAGDITKGGKCDGTEENPYEINCIEDLIAFSMSININNKTYSGKYIVLKRDLNFNSIFSYNDYRTTEYDEYLEGDGTVELKTQLANNGFKTIAYISSGYRYFRGTFDGQRHRILGLYEKNNNRGLFGDVKNATIKNLYVEGRIESELHAGGIMFCATNSYIYNCISNITLSGQSAGGIAGRSDLSYFINCANIGDVSGKWQSGVGGIIGEASNSYIYNSYNLGNLTMNGGNSYCGAGGIVGYANGDNITIENCYNVGNLESSRYKGGIIGSSNTTITINNCYYIDNVTTGVGNSEGGTSITLAQAKNSEKIDEKYIIELLNSYVSTNINVTEKNVELKSWKLGEDGYPTFE